MSESKYKDAWKKGFDSGVKSQKECCVFDCDKNYDEYKNGYNQALEDTLEVLKVWEDSKEKFIEYLELKMEVQKKINN